jgi:hypothetical protein
MISHRYRAALVAAAVLGTANMAPPGSVNFRYGPGFHATTPSGYSILVLRPSGITVELLGLIECPEIEGMQQVSQGLNARVISPQGIPVNHFPHHFSFRITATLRRPIPEPPDQVVNTEQDPQQFLLSLRFRLKIYHGLSMHQIEPDSVTLIGVPGDIAYDERIFRVQFAVDDLPVTDRLILEAVSPQGEAVSHFPFVML